MIISRTMPLLKAFVLLLVIEIKQILLLDLFAFTIIILYKTSKSWINIKQMIGKDKKNILVYM